MSVRSARRAVAALAVIAGVLVLSASSVGAASSDLTPPTKPSNLRVTGKTLTSVSMAWNASSDNSGSFNYVVRL